MREVPESVKGYFTTSIFGIDINYDKITAESMCAPCCRLTLKGSRKVILTDALQLLGFMQRKNVQ
eukprot:4112377-Amphidinium_carterae.1